MFPVWELSLHCSYYSGVTGKVVDSQAVGLSCPQLYLLLW